MIRQVPFFNYPKMHLVDSPKYMDSLLDVLTRSDYILRGDLESFEKQLSNYIGVKHVIGVGNGTDAIWISLIAAGIKAGDEVIIPAHTYIATADAIRIIGATPVLVDCDEGHSIAVDAIKPSITKKTTAVIAVNLNGRAASLIEIKAICDDQGIILIEDNAQGLGAQIGGQSTGTFGAAGTLSFFPAKNLGCLGDGGAVVTNNDEFAEKVKMLRNHGRDDSGEVVTWGLNSRLDNIQANILNSKLPYLGESIELRREFARLYDEGLSDLKTVRLPRPPTSGTEYYDSFQNYEIEAEDRDLLREFLKKRGIGTILPWAGKAIHQFGLEGIRKSDLRKTEELFKKVILLPMNQYLDIDDIDYVVSQVQEFYK